jgi:hypothetical protein
MKYVAWMGIVLIVLGAFSWLLFYLLVPKPLMSGGYPVMNLSFLFTPLFDVLGLILIFVGGFISNPKYFWLACIVTSILHFGITFTSIVQDISPHINTPSFADVLRSEDDFFLMSLVPFVITLFEGIILKMKQNRKNSGL